MLRADVEAADPAAAQQRAAARLSQGHRLPAPHARLLRRRAQDQVSSGTHQAATFLPCSYVFIRQVSLRFFTEITCNLYRC